MKRTSIVAVTLALSMLAPMSAMAAANSNPLAFDAAKKIAAEKTKLLTETYGITSVQYALIDDGEITISGHAGKNDLTDSIPLSSKTIYGIGSTSKMFLTAAVMKLVDEGKVDLDSPVVNYIPDFKMKDSRYKQITPRMLLNHSSGFLGTTGNNATLYGDNDTFAHDTFLEQLATQSLKADPGAFSVYCNDGFTLAEILVERVSGIGFTAFIHKYITEPLDMSHTKTPQDLIDQAALAGSYSPLYEGQLPQENYNIIATGGLYSTAEDLAAFSQIFTGQAEGIISAKSLEAMAQEEYKSGMWPEEANPSYLSYGLGWDSVHLFPFNEYGIKALSKGGDTISYHSSLVVLPEYKLSAAVISSGGSSALDQMIANELLLSVLQEKGVIKERKPEESYGVPIKADMPQEITQYAGIYGSGSNKLLKIEVNTEGEMAVSTVTAPNNPAQTYTYTADGSFVNDEGTEKLKFVEEKNGHAYLWSRSYIAVPGIGQTAISEYNAEKLEDNPLAQDVADAWEQRDGQKYYWVNGKYTSTSYLHSTPIIPFQTIKAVPGYVLNHKIIGANKAVNQLQIPGMDGRDTMEIEFFKKNGVEYLKAAGNLYASGELVKPLYSGKQSWATIQADGEAKWYTVSAKDKGKVLTVNMPAHGSFAVYNQAGICINHTVISDNNQVVLPENGSVVFAGEVGSTFGISLKK
ncbi:serine hydrolase domain-containing protein [Paenibacillus sp. Leaf72]|uniref:serine hydrolase domain-containing protein n=1 Tax=Paenibacillus sp. Leaf72 TaxID=1736234 RepID=UPI0006F73B4E|nr:serine hydrolase domain-containing protein [Paenibacillus sp. Leaf72]KQO18622.1 serine hydrolase [Paenibacillus sp. Leaf72]